MTPREQNQLEVQVPEEVSLQIFEEGEKRRFLEVFIILAKHKFFILYFVLSATVLSVVVSLLLPPYFTATTKILPPQQGQSIASAMLGDLGPIGGLLSAATGKDLLKNPSDLYVAMLKSTALEDDLVKRFDLKSLYGKKLNVDARHKLEDLSLIESSKEGVISVAVEDHDPGRAAEISSAYIDELEKLTKKLAVTDASKRRVFFEREAKVANDQLAEAEQALKQTEETTGVFQPDSQTRVMLEAYADLKAQVTAKEVELQAMRSFATAENPDLVRTEHELAALQAQVARYEQGQGGRPIGDIALEKVPAKALQYVRKYREVKYREAMLQLMLKQYEIARIDEGKDASLIQVLDPALPPERKSSPKRAIIVLSVTFLALLIAILWVYLKEAMEHAREDPQYLTRLQLLKFYLLRKRRSPDLGA
ncbi:MAG TPA: Wzz/FepE/Etk N-terminal domain-containing protein [Candidatus Angelobacter sp.]|nr:Wzz/FepE/Etk N-terminal domain-containing protein [Candidatus Angelobacter sp.]